MRYGVITCHPASRDLAVNGGTHPAPASMPDCRDVVTHSRSYELCYKDKAKAHTSTFTRVLTRLTQACNAKARMA